MRDNPSPGYRLKSLLSEILPNDENGFDRNDKRFHNRIDFVLSSEGKFSDLIHDSIINYVVRRLIMTAQFVARRANEDGLTHLMFTTNLKASLRDNFNFQPPEREKILSVLLECIEAHTQELNDATKRQLKREAKKYDSRCYICGKEVSFEAKDGAHNAIEIEHIWPHSMGGTNGIDNLKIACHKCNQAKKSIISFSDFHFEIINEVKSNLNHYEKMAIWSKNNFRCMQCNKPASEVGPLTIVQINKNDSWHFTNLEAYCSVHAKDN
jgi:HNH endonuclease